MINDGNINLFRRSFFYCKYFYYAHVMCVMSAMPVKSIRTCLVGFLKTTQQLFGMQKRTFI